MNSSLEDLIDSLYGIKQEDFFDFKELLDIPESMNNKTNINYQVSTDFDVVDQTILDTILAHYKQRPVIVFVNLRL